MLLRLFTQNNRGLLLVYPLISVLVMLLQWKLDETSPQTVVLYASDYIFNTGQNFGFLTFSLGILITACIAWLMNSAFNNSELYFQPSYLIGFLATLVFAVGFYKHPSLNCILSQLFLTIGLYFSLRIQNQKRIYSSVFLAQLSVGISICLFPQNIGFFIAIPMILILNRSFSFKELFFGIVISIIPLIYWISYSYLTNQMNDWFFWMHKKHDGETMNFLSSLFFWICSLSLGVSVLSIFKKESRQTNKTQQAKNTILLFLTSSLVSWAICYLIREPFTLYNFSLPFVMVAGYYWTHYRVSLLAPFVFYSWLLFLILFAFNFIH
jgi:hypothetical protein